mmetsp:Transcript_26243/g.55707  ORF Transcript_26243/g.55707 Transcript_26243/m.55707 type:complete len:203 (+) Transcript_26243:116-724(+)
MATTLSLANSRQKPAAGGNSGCGLWNLAGDHAERHLEAATSRRAPSGAHELDEAHGNAGDMGDRGDFALAEALVEQLRGERPTDPGICATKLVSGFGNDLCNRPKGTDGAVATLGVPAHTCGKSTGVPTASRDCGRDAVDAGSTAVTDSTSVGSGEASAAHSGVERSDSQPSKAEDRAAGPVLPSPAGRPCQRPMLHSEPGN